MIRRAWLQKHPTPVARAGEFHWYPADRDAQLRAGFVERLAGANAGDVLWELAPGRAAWAQTFAASAPLDGRRYVGMVLAIVEGDAPPADLLAQVQPPRAGPWAEEAERVAASPVALVAALPDPAAVARALLEGGAAAVGDLAAPGLPRALAAIERCMPAPVTERARRGAWTAGTAQRASDRVAELAAAAVAQPMSRAAAGWRLMSELASRDRSVDDVAAELDRETADAREWLGTLNAWGRGRAERTVEELADRVALRALAELVGDRDPARAIAEARWQALLPRPRRDELLAAVGRRATLLRVLLDA